MDYRLSANYLNQNGIIDGTNTKRVTLGVNYNQRLFNDRLNLQVQCCEAPARDDEFTPGGVLSNAAQMGPTQPVNDPTQRDRLLQLAEAGRHPVGGQPGGDSEAGRATRARPIAASATCRPVTACPGSTGLKANVNLGYDITKAERVARSPRASCTAKSRPVTAATIIRNNPTQLNTVLETYLNYAVPRPVGPGTLDVTGGYSYTKSHGRVPSNPWPTGLSTDVLGTDGIPSAKTDHEHHWTSRRAS